MGLRRDVEPMTRFAASSVASFAAPAVAGIVEVAVLGNDDGDAGLVDPLEAAVALPFVSSGPQVRVRGQRDLFASRVDLPEAPVAAPSVARRVEMRVRRNFDGVARVADLPVAPVALPSVSVATRVGVWRNRHIPHRLAGRDLRRRRRKRRESRGPLRRVSRCFEMDFMAGSSASCCVGGSVGPGVAGRLLHERGLPPRSRQHEPLSRSARAPGSLDAAPHPRDNVATRGPPSYEAVPTFDSGPTRLLEPLRRIVTGVGVPVRRRLLVVETRLSTEVVVVLELLLEGRRR